MSYENVPKNLTEKAVLIRGGRPDYLKLEADSFPTPSADEAGAILENTDTGTRYRWTSTTWVPIGVEGYGNVRNTPLGDYFVQSAAGRIAGTSMAQFTGRNLNIGNASFETMWDQGGNYTYLTANTQLYISSSSAADIAVLVAVTGLDDTYAPVTLFVTTNGQNQVALSGTIFRVFEATVLSSTTPVGELYIAESDTLTAGVPNTASKIKAKISLTSSDSGAFASNNKSFSGIWTVPAGYTAHGLMLLITAAKGKDITLMLRVRPYGGCWINTGMNWTYNSLTDLNLLNRPPVPEKTDLEVRGISSSAGGQAEFNFSFNLLAN